MSVLCDGVGSAGSQWKEGLLSMADSVRWSYGAGMVMRLGGIARLELNYVVPMTVQPTDRFEPCVRFTCILQWQIKGGGR